MKTKLRTSRAIAKCGVLLAVIALLAVGLGFLPDTRVVRADNTYFALTPGTPFSQDWSNPALITIDNNWSTVPSISGFIGSVSPDLPAGTDPQTVLDGSSLGFITQNVNADETNPDTFGTGGVAEFDTIGNPTVALQGSANADAPNLQLLLDTTGCAGASNQINVAYNVRDIDGSSDDAVQQVALQYRLGTFGNFTNVLSGYIPDATTGGTATQVTSITTNMPTATKGQPQLHVRILTTNAAGIDEWVGIDDINVTCQTVLAAGATIRGRVMNSSGRGVMGTTVTLIGGTFLMPVYARTNPFGYYTFTNIPTGHAYVVSVSSKSLYFPEPSRVISLDDDISGVDFIAGQGK